MLITSIYTLTIFTSAFLLFLIQPMISKLLLPHLGGSPAVWNTAMMFFQIALLLGYAYAHISGKWLGAKKQSLVHIVLLVAALAFLPITARTDLGFISSLHPICWVMLSLALSVGVPFFALAANAPLLQFWLSRTGHKDAQNPYFLYSASNIGSLLALLGYPFVVEPLLTLPQQTMMWSGLFILFVALILACVAYVQQHYVPAAADAAATSAAKPPLLRKLHWILLSFCPSSLLLGVTTYITTDLASMPLFWVIPLAIYLLTFIFAFARRPLLVDRALAAQVVLVPLTALVMLFDLNAVTSVLLLHLFTFFALVMGCHGTLARLKPDAAYLTEFYLWISFGGMLGGVFNALVAPQIFTAPFEYPLVFILTLLLRPQLIPDSRRERLMDYAVPAGFLMLVALICRLLSSDRAGAEATARYALSHNILPMLLFVPVVVMAVRTYRRPMRYALCILALFIAVPAGKMIGNKEPAPGQLLFEERNFFGVNRLFNWAPTNAMLLLHGTTLHGMQPLEEGKRLQLATYYGGMREVYDHLAPGLQQKPVAVLGLGAGTLACIGHKGQAFDFYEIDPAIAGIARNREFFTYLSDCPPHSNIILGDGRLEIARAGQGQYGFIAVDTFSSDAIPMHILTREALKIYTDKLANGGMMAFNISNRHLALGPVMARLAGDAGMAALIKRDSKQVDNSFMSSSIWVLMARDEKDFHGLEKDDPSWLPLKGDGKSSIWTDNYSNIFETLF